MKYILVTDFENHWEKLEGKFTSFPKNMMGPALRKQPIVDETETIFIKKRKHSDTIEKSWIGKVRDIQFLTGKVFFRVEIRAEIICPTEYASFPNGWFCDPRDS